MESVPLAGRCEPAAPASPSPAASPSPLLCAGRCQLTRCLRSMPCLCCSTRLSPSSRPISAPKHVHPNCLHHPMLSQLLSRHRDHCSPSRAPLTLTSPLLLEHPVNLHPSLCSGRTSYVLLPAGCNPTHALCPPACSLQWQLFRTTL